MNHKGTQTIKTERLILRQFTEADANDMYNNWASDEEVIKFLIWERHKSLEDTAQNLKSYFLDNYHKDDFYDWCIEFEGQAIGSIGVVMSINDAAEIGYCLSRKHWGKGIIPEAAKEIIAFLFHCGYNRIVAKHDLKNSNSGKVMQKCGMEFLEIVENGAINNQGPCDVAYYCIIKDSA